MTKAQRSIVGGACIGVLLVAGIATDRLIRVDDGLNPPGSVAAVSWIAWLGSLAIFIVLTVSIVGIPRMRTILKPGALVALLLIVVGTLVRPDLFRQFDRDLWMRSRPGINFESGDIRVVASLEYDAIRSVIAPLRRRPLIEKELGRPDAVVEVDGKHHAQYSIGCDASGSECRYLVILYHDDLVESVTPSSPYPYSLRFAPIWE